MGTRTIKPLSNNAGQLGSSTKYWNKGYINELYINEIHTSSTSTLSALGISIKPSTGIVFEGATPDEFETQLLSSDPSADRVILLPDATGIIALTTDIGVTTLSGTTANGLTTYASAGTLDVEQYLTFENSGNISTLSLLSNEDTGDKFSIATTTHGATTISTVDDDTTLAHLTLDVHGDITLDAQGKNVYMARDGSNVFDFNVDTSSMKIMDTTDSGDYFSIATTTHGATTLTTVDDDNSGSAASADLTLNIDGDIVLNSETGAGATGGIKFQQVGTEFMNFTAHHAGSFLQILGNGGTSTGDSFFIDVAEHGDTTLTTVDAAGAQGHFRIESDGDIILNPGSGNIQIQDTAAELVSAGQHIHKQVKVVLSQANCNDLHSTPIELIPSQGANTIIVPQSGIMMVDNNTSVNQTNSSADLNFHYADKEPGAYGTTTLFHIRRFMNTNHLTDIVYSLGEMSGFEISQNLTDCVDKAVEVSVDSALTNNSMTSITIYLSYHVINIS